MVTLRLFHASNPFKPIESRVVASGEIAVGRDPAADWPIEDAACELSRRHCCILVTQNGVRVRDTSANGVYLGRERRRLQRDVEVLLGAEDVIHFGQFMIVVDEKAPAAANDCVNDRSLDAPFHSPMLAEPELTADAFKVREGWKAPGDDGARRPLPDAALLEAFCEGAGLDPSVFMGDLPADVMRRAGAAYRQAVLGLSDLMGERTSVKSAYRMDRTTVGAADNNPFKWADPHRVAVDLLRSGNGSFLNGAAAITESFQDLKKHLLCLMAGSRAAVAAALEEIGPERVEQGVKGQSLLFQTKVDACWREFQKRHEQITAEARENADSVINRAFKAGYEGHVRKLDGLGTLS